MQQNKSQDARLYHVVVNDEEQYSMWAAGREVPRGWQIVAQRGPKAGCLDHTNEIWTDMWPLSLRKKMESAS
jgi:MbtH protein